MSFKKSFSVYFEKQTQTNHSLQPNFPRENKSGESHQDEEEPVAHGGLTQGSETHWDSAGIGFEENLQLSAADTK